MIRILIVETWSLFGKALAALLEHDDELEILGDVQSIDAIAAYGTRPDVIVFDLDKHDDPLHQWVARIYTISPGARLCVIAERFCASDIECYLESGIEGLVLKDIPPGEFIRAIKMVARKETYVDPRVAGTLLRRRPQDTASPVALTLRETQIVRLIADGLSNKEISVRLELSEKTVKSHLGRIFAKLKITGRTRAAVHAIKTGLA